MFFLNNNRTIFQCSSALIFQNTPCELLPGSLGKRPRSEYGEDGSREGESAEAEGLQREDRSGGWVRNMVVPKNGISPLPQHTPLWITRGSKTLLGNSITSSAWCI